MGQILGDLWSQIGTYYRNLWKFITKSKMIQKIWNHLCYVCHPIFFLWKMR
jgi:hypothetical protein